jgi:hypothetical protein
MALPLALLLVALAVTLLGPAETLAQTRKGCPTSASHSRTRHVARGCTQPSHRGKSKSQTHHKHHTKLAPNKKTSKAGAPAATSAIPARCERGETPARSAEGTFSCSDGSEPECESGAKPTASRKGDALVCPVAGATEAEASSTGHECEEEGLACSTGAGEPACETPDSSNSSEFACEG